MSSQSQKVMLQKFLSSSLLRVHEQQKWILITKEAHLLLVLLVTIGEYTSF
jgi:hypothetical protein